jgi:NAD-dependent SIR2 family protein deacetylase
LLICRSGISTSCGIPDFRGPNGIWTIQKRLKAAAKAAASDETPSNQSRGSNFSDTSSNSSKKSTSGGQNQPRAQKRKRENSGTNVNHSNAKEEDDKDDLESLRDSKKPKIKEEDETKSLMQAGEVTWQDAQPGLTHMALMALTKKGVIEYIVTQNVDGLHVKSGIAPAKLSELHGNVFKEKV